MLRIASFLIGIILCFVGVFQWVIPAYGVWQKANSDREIALDSLRVVQEKIENFKSVSVALGEHQGVLNEAQSYLPEDPREEAILSLISEVGKRSGVYIADLQVNSEKEDIQQEQSLRIGDGRDMVDADLSGEMMVSDSALGDTSLLGGELRKKYVRAEIGIAGSYENIKEFMRDISDSIRNTEIISVTISPNSKEGGEEGEENISPDALSAKVSIRFVYALPTIASPRGILDSFASRSVAVITTASENARNSIQEGDSLESIEYTSGGRANPFLP